MAQFCWELQHLRQHAADLAEQLDVERGAGHQAELDAELWQGQATNVELGADQQLGLMVDGTQHVIAASLAAQHTGACREGGAS